MSKSPKTEPLQLNAVNMNEQFDKNNKFSTTSDPFILESVFKDPIALLKLPTTAAKDIAKNAVFALDTNALLVPFGVGRAGQDEITTLYKGLNEHNRLFAPERAIREFLRHRSRAVAELLTSLNKEVASLDKQVAPPVCAMLEYSKEYSNLLEAASKLKDARKTYLQSLQSLIQTLGDWRWSDPIIALYAEVFEEKSIAKCSLTREDILKDLAHRVLHKIPPGYKDAGKEDGGVGDVLIWHSLLGLAKLANTAVVFVTGEEKADWMTRSDGKPLYPRFELVAEFFEKTGQPFVIVDYVRFLQLHELSPETVDQARHSYAEGLGRFAKLRQKIVSILDLLRDIANDYQYSSEFGKSNPIRDNRIIGLIGGFHECFDTYRLVNPNGAGLMYLEFFSELLTRMRSLNTSIEYEEVRMKNSTVAFEQQLASLCREFVVSMYGST